MTKNVVFMKLKIVGAYWKLDLVMRLANLLGMHTEFYSGGSGNGDGF